MKPAKKAMPSEKPTLVQCDFDGTVTLGDVSFLILDEFTGTGWRALFQDYMEGRMTVNAFNTAAFARVRASRKTLDRFVRQHTVIRPGLSELINACRERGFRFVIVSNGMAFYIETILKMLGLGDVEFIAGQAEFTPEGIRAWYPGPDGQPVEDGFKESHTRHFLEQGYRVIYVGNGASDLSPARLCQRVFAINQLRDRCLEAGVENTHFADLKEVARAIRALDYAGRRFCCQS